MITEGFTTDNAQFVKLMDNAVNVSGILGLEIGKAPSAEQLANLTEDIVWMEEKVVNGQKVLVPVVYLAKDYSSLGGANIIANNVIDLSVSGSLNNNENLLANNLVKLNASSITNNGGVIFSNGTAILVSTDNMVNKNGGSIKAAEVAIASTSGSVINETSAQVNNVKNGRDDIAYTMMSKTSSIEATNGELVIAAQKDIQNIGASLSASSNLVLATKEGDINVKALETKTGHKIYFSGGFDKGGFKEN
jgi:filamentous hemagglutinin